MNERIQELWREAHDYANKQAWVDVTKNVSHIFAEKFAELIVKECVEIGQHEFLHGSTVPVFPAIQIKQHFGVEE